ncbi:MAG TPA: aldehyde ferredoxin oxidoreductase family protein [Chloroflexota bacterium]|nr:aldehyde ferredoxin oxidoreductase family protein [Chloroflexota bacterium]
MPPYGYMGRILEVDLSSGEVSTRELTRELADRWIGGTGLGAYLLAQEPRTATADPLSSDNVLIYGTGPYTGTQVPLSNRFGVCARSPLTGVFGEAECGGHWANTFKQAGYDMLVIRGKAAKPVYLWVKDDGVEIRDAGHLWGADTFETHDRLLEEVGSGDRRGGAPGVACIGPAGERLAPVAAIMVDGRDGRAVGRCGLGAVMGSKNLKAVIARGTKSFPIYDEQALKTALNRVRRDIVQQAKGFGQLGTAGGIPTHEKMGNWPVKNWGQSHWPDGPDKISGATMAESILTGRYYCGNCIIGCGRTVEVKEGPYAGIEQGGLEYETTALNGANLLVGDIAAVQKANEICNRYGMDTISAGAVVGFAMEAYERGLLTKVETGGIELDWGSDKALVQAMTRMGERDTEFGRRLGEGTARLAEEIGGRDFAIHVRGLDFPAHDPRAFFANAVAYATSARGACHLSSFGHVFQRVLTLPELGYDEPVNRHDAERTPELVYHGQNLMGLFDSLKCCKFIMFGGIKPTHLLEWYNAITGRGLNVDQFLEIGARIFNQKRLYNFMCGSTGADDVLPRRILEEAREVGGSELVPPFEPMLKAYYKIRGWDEQGTPLPETLELLGLPDAVPSS